MLTAMKKLFTVDDHYAMARAGTIAEDAARYAAIKSVNKEPVGPYWDIGRFDRGTSG